MQTEETKTQLWIWNMTSYKNQEEFYYEIEQVFLEDYNIKLSYEDIQKTWEWIKNLCTMFLN